MTSEIENFHKVIKSTAKPVFAMVSATWCNPCKIIKPEFMGKSETEKDKATFILIDADESQELCMHYEITAIPTIMVFKNSDTDVLERFSGSNLDSFNKFVNKHLAN